MSNELKAKVEELSILLVMASADDPSSMELPLATCEELISLAAATAWAGRVTNAAKFCLALGKTAEAHAKLTLLVTELGKLIDGEQQVSLPGETSTQCAASNADLAPDLDPSFVTEFIETHLIHIEEFEGSVIEFSRAGGDAEELTISVKRYLHNLKGDAGSVGLCGIERACHRLEDLVVERGAAPLIPQIISFKEWAVSVMKAMVKGESVPKLSAQFLEELEASMQKPVPPPVPEKPAPAPAKEAKPSSSHGTKLPPTYPLTGESDILIEFAAEAEEHLTNVESIILEQSSGYSKESVDAIFRAVHSIKGGSAYFGLIEMTNCSHMLENMLHEVRDGKRVLDEELRALLLTYIDLQKEVLKRAKGCVASQSAMETSVNSQVFLDDLDRYASGTGPSKSAPPPKEPEQEQAAEQVEVSGNNAAGKNDKLQVKNFVKVDTARLDELIDSIGEMVIYSTMLVRQCRERLEDDQNIMNTTHRVEKFARDLQDIGMSMRLIPIKGLFQKMSRLVWDASKKLGKQIDFEVEGEDTELDRNLIDKLADPLMHMVRNALDHGVELPNAREKAGKSRQGHVKLAAFHSGGSIHIQVKDDGKGLDPDKLVAKAIEKGIVRPGQRLTSQEAYQLIFAAGFSTAQVVTDISGRGVGMDVVRRNVESLRGRIHIESEVGKGSTFTIELPLTLAIIDGIQVKVGTEYFIVPSLSIVEFVRPNAESINTAFDQGETFHFRNKYLPVFSLSKLYNIETAVKSPCDGTMVVVENGTEQVAIFVDSILGEYSTVIKSLSPIFGDQKGLAGCAVMPDGGVSLILDVHSLIELARKTNAQDGSRIAAKPVATATNVPVH